MKKKKWRWFCILMPIAAWIGLLVCPAFSPAETVTAYFDDGDTTDEVDGFRGKEGEGWQGAWTVEENGRNSPTVQVLEPGEEALGYSEIKSGCTNYLDMEIAATGSDARYGEARQYAAEGAAIDPTLSYPITYEFTVRINEDVDDENSPFTYRHDRYLILEYTEPRSNGGAGATWATSVIGEDKDTGDELEAKEWDFKDGDNAGHDSPVPTGIFAVTGGVYDFTIVVDPTDCTWDGTITHVNKEGGAESCTKTDLGWRTSATQVGGFLNFLARSSGSDDVRDWSVDNIEITQVPEPSTGVLMLLGVLTGCLLRRSRR